jgi:hypothetical protein
MKARNAAVLKDADAKARAVHSPTVWPVWAAATEIAQQAIETANVVKRRLIGLCGEAHQTIQRNARRRSAANKVR